MATGLGHINLNLGQFVAVMVRLNQVFFIDGVIGKCVMAFIPNQFFPAAVGYIPHLSHGSDVRAGLYGAMEVLSLTRFYRGYEVFPVLIHAIVR
jgi:hypothetical protein